MAIIFSSLSSRLMCVASVAAAASLAIGGGAHAAPYKETAFLGDSLVDTGFFKGVRGADASFTTNPDPTWSRLLASALGTNADPAWVAGLPQPAPAGGSNYAAGGARVVLPGLAFDPAITPLIPSADQEASSLLARSPRLNRHGLYSIWAGANDIFVSLIEQTGALQSPLTQAAATQLVLMDAARAGMADAAVVDRLRAAGAGTVLVMNLPDIGNTPMGINSPHGQLLSFASQQFNESLNSSLAHYRGNLVALDVSGIFDEIIREPGRFGLSNVTASGCTSTDPVTGSLSSQFCGRGTLAEPNANDTYLFADVVHPTGAGHRLINDYVLSVLQAPARMGLLAEAPLAGYRAGLGVIDDRLRKRDSSEAPQVYAAYTHSNDQQTSGNPWKPGLGNNVDMLAMGDDAGIGPHWTLGGSIAQAQHDATLGEAGGSFRLGQTLLSGYARYRLSDWSAGLVGSVGYLNYGSVSRDFSIGAARLSEHGKTTGTMTALSGITAYDWHLGSVTVSPSVRLTMQHVDVRGFNESRSGRTATSMNYGDQQRDSLVSVVGITAQAEWQEGGRGWRPFASAAWEHEYRDGDRSIRAHVRDMAGSFSQTVAAPPVDTLLASAGFGVALARTWEAQAAYYGRYASGYRSHALQAVLTHSF